MCYYNKDMVAHSLECKKCKITKASSEFSPTYTTCKECKNAYRREWHLRNLEVRREKDKLRMAKFRSENPEYVARARQKARKYAEANRAKNLKYALERQAAGREFINTFKSKPCMDCGGSFPPHVMDFDHVRGEKVSNIGEMGNYSFDSIKEEISKCDLICANCHRIRTYNRLQERLQQPTSES